MIEPAISQDRPSHIVAMALPKKACQSPQFKRTWTRSIRDYVVYRTVISKATLDDAIEAVASQEIEQEALLLNRYHVSEEELGAALSRYYHCPFLSL
ncbi:MAG: hypothetical protein HP493_07665, partial [Nitrospira sp.]|nr:hypothetical protein [Nitrospira sp.]